MTRLTVATALCALTYLALSDSAATTQAAEAQTVFQHQACVDCPVMRVNYYAPKP